MSFDSKQHTALQLCYIVLRLNSKLLVLTGTAGRSAPRRFLPILAFQRRGAGLDASRLGMLEVSEIHPTPNDARPILALRFLRGLADHASAAIQTDGSNTFRLMVLGFRNAVKEQMKSVILGRKFLEGIAG